MITVHRSRSAKLPGTDKIAREVIADLYIVPAVGPKGEFLECKVTRGTGGDVPVRWSNEAEAPVLTKKYKDKGWYLFEDYCTRNGCIEFYDRWRKWYDLRESGREVDPQQWESLRSKFYPPAILELKRRFEGGRERLDESEILGLIEDEPAKAAGPVEDKPKRGRPRKSVSADA
jgi:hypothetical protein